MLMTGTTQLPKLPPPSLLSLPSTKNDRAVAAMANKLRQSVDKVNASSTFGIDVNGNVNY